MLPESRRHKHSTPCPSSEANAHSCKCPHHEGCKAGLLAQQGSDPASTDESIAKVAGYCSDWEAKVFSGFNHSYHSSRQQRARWHSERRQEGLCSCWLQKDPASLLTYRRAWVHDLKMCPFLPNATIYLVQKIASPCKIHLTSIHSPPYSCSLTIVTSAKPLLFFLLASRRKSFLSSSWWPLKTRRRFLLPHPP